MQIQTERMAPRRTRVDADGAAANAHEHRAAQDGKIASVDPQQKSCGAACNSHPKQMCDKASPAHAVMLHLRARYVSKAAILTTPAHFVPVENRSPA
jgi:hypothetical protein